jgi:hypothetical protein
MSLTNPNTVVTEQRLNDFYQGILPYLGGMPEMLANKFSKGDLYSTDEKMIGQWIDGKPLYQKTFEVGYLANKSFTQVNITTLMNTVDTVIDLQGIAVNESNKSVRPLCLADGIDDTNNIRMDIIYENNSIYNLRVVTNANWGENAYKIYSTLKYTKTTDSAISIGNDTDYSTEEKIIGTWIDGKPIYQKVLRPSSDITITTSMTNIHDVSDLNIETLVEGAVHRFPNQGTSMLETDYDSGYIRAKTLSVNLPYYTNGFTIIQYTKTTD